MKKLLSGFLALCMMVGLFSAMAGTVSAAEETQHGIVVSIDYWQTPNKLGVLMEGNGGLVWANFSGNTNLFSPGTLVSTSDGKTVNVANNPPKQIAVDCTNAIKLTSDAVLYVPKGVTVVLNSPISFHPGGRIDVYGTLIINDLLLVDGLTVRDGGVLTVNAKMRGAYTGTESYDYGNVGNMTIEEGAEVNGSYLVGIDPSLRGPFLYNAGKEWWIQDLDSDQKYEDPSVRNDIALDTPEARKHYLAPGRQGQDDYYTYADPTIIELAGKITAGSRTDYEKALAVHDWLSSNIWYDYDYYHYHLLTSVSPESYEGKWSLEYLESVSDTFSTDPLEVLKSQRTVCAGYTRLTNDLLRAAGIPARTVSNQDQWDAHAWTEAYVDDRWMIIDTTWDCLNEWQDGQKRVTKECRHTYFDFDYEDEDYTHRPMEYSPAYGYQIDSGLLLRGDRWGDVALPNEIAGIGSRAFYKNTGLTGVTLPETISEIKNSAFEGCTSLTSVQLPNSLRELDLSAFRGCTALRKLVIPDGVTYLTGSPGLADFKIVSSSAYVEQYAKKQGIQFETRSKTTAEPNTSTVLVNSESIAFDAYNIDGNNYFKLRDIAYVLSGTEKRFEVGWDSASNVISLTSGQAYTAVGGEMKGKETGMKTPTATTSIITLDGRPVTFRAYTIEGNNYFKLRDIGQAFDFEIDWDSASNTIIIDTGKGYTAD